MAFFVLRNLRPRRGADNLPIVLRLSLADFVEEELLRAPLVFDAVVDAVHDQWRQTLVVHGRDSGSLTRMLHLHRATFTTEALRTLRLAVSDSVREIVSFKPLRGAALRPRSRTLNEMKLVDEADVVADLACGRCTERIVSDAEVELRDMHAYTSALVGDRRVSRQTNPLRPAHFARALWTACQGLPAVQPVRDDFFRRATPALAQSIRSSLSAACARLEAQGVSSAVHRTVVLGPESSALPGPAQEPVVGRYTAPPQNLSRLRTRMRVPSDDSTMQGRLDDATSTQQAGFEQRTQQAGFEQRTQPDHFRASPEEASAAASPSSAEVASSPADDPQLAAMMARLYVHMTQDAGLPPDVSELLSRLKSSFDRIALTDGAMVDGFDHPVWRFFDRLAFAVETVPQGERARMLGLARNLIDNLADDTGADASRFAWAIDKLDAQERQSLRLATRAAAGDIVRLVQTERLSKSGDLPAGQSDQDAAQVALDIESLDTVPGAVMLEPSTASEHAPLVIDKVHPGERMRMYLQGQWRPLQLLWSRDDLWLLRDLEDDRKWVLRPGAIERLIAERLAQPLRIRSLARRAAERMQDEV